MKGLQIMSNLYEPLTSRNTELTYETQEEKIKRLKNKFNLYHGKGKRKKKK